MKENESFLEHKARKRKGSQGKSSETAVHSALVKFKAGNPCFDFDRNYDTRSAGALLPAGVSDYTLFCRGNSYALAVKEISKGTRLPKFKQLPRLNRRTYAGVFCLVLVHFVEVDAWYLKGVDWFLVRPAASWDFKDETKDKFATAEAALKERLRL